MDSTADSSGSEDRAQAELGAEPASTSQPELHATASLQAASRRLRAFDAYREHMERADADIDLVECALLLAQHADPDLDMEACIAKIDALAEGVRRQLPDEAYPLRILQTISRHLYQEEGFHGNEAKYFDVDNSCLNSVLETRAGIPITLGVLYMAVAQRVGLPMHGINLPGHFMIKPSQEDLEVLVDPFHGGEICFLQDAEEKLSRLYAAKVKVAPSIMRPTAAMSSRRVLARMLQNLRLIYIGANMPENLLRSIQYMRATCPDTPEIIRDEGICLYRLGRYRECEACMYEYLKTRPPTDDVKQVNKLLERLRIERQWKEFDQI